MKSDRLELLRQDLGLSKAKMAAMMGIEPAYYSNILAGMGKGNLRIEHLESLLREANANPVWILTGKGPMYLGNPESFGRDLEPTEEQVEALYSFLQKKYPADLNLNQRYMVKLACAQTFIEYPELTTIDSLALPASVYYKVIVRIPTINVINMLGLEEELHSSTSEH